jgi:hypothetical protein
MTGQQLIGMERRSERMTGQSDRIQGRGQLHETEK